jgi:hypothetical protein
MCIQTAMELLMRFTQGDSLLPGGRGGSYKAEGLDVGPLSANSEGSPMSSEEEGE